MITYAAAQITFGRQHITALFMFPQFLSFTAYKSVISPSMIGASIIPMPDTRHADVIIKNNVTHAPHIRFVSMHSFACKKIAGSTNDARRAFPCQIRIDRNVPCV